MAKRGNPNPKGGKPDKLIRDALMGAIRQSPEKLKRAAESVLDRASEGDQTAMQFLADRIDGKAVQPIANDDEGGFEIVVRQVSRVVVDDAKS